MLLAAATRLLPAGSLRALHVDHALHADSAEWERRCAGAAARLGVAYRSLRVAVEPARGTGLEAAARAARYAALARLLEPGETLLTAHHADDQLETLLLRLLRGTGVRGLRGVLPRAPFGPGFLARPLLGFTRAELRAQAERWGLDWLEDPSNRCLQFDRNYLRAAVLPALRARWPRAAQTAVRLGAAAEDAEQILAEAARADLEAAGGAARPAAAALAALGAARQRNALRAAIDSAGLPSPTSRQLEVLRASLAVSRADACTEVRWPGAEARIYRGRLYLLAPRAPASGAGRGARVSATEAWEGPEGRLALVPATAAAPPEVVLPDVLAREGLELEFRAGGERFVPAGARHRRKLKQWFQEQGIVPWMRERIPLLYWRGRLVAVADLAVASDLPAASPGEPGWRVRWDGHPPLR